MCDKSKSINVGRSTDDEVFEYFHLQMYFNFKVVSLSFKNVKYVFLLRIFKHAKQGQIQALNQD